MRIIKHGAFKLVLSKNEASNFNRLLALPIGDRQKQFDAWFNAVPKGSEAQDRRRLVALQLKLEVPK